VDWALLINTSETLKMTNTVIKHFRIIPRDSEYLDRKLGSRGEIYFDQDQNTLRLYSGDILGGVDLSKADLSNIDVNTFRNKSVESKLATVVYNVTVTGPESPDTGNKYNLNAVYRPEPNFVVGYTYVFVQDDPSNVYFPNNNNTTPNPHPLNFSADNLSGQLGGGTSYLADVRYFLNGVTVTQAVYNGPRFITATSRQVHVTVTNQTPATLYYWCWNHQAMGNIISVADPGSGTGGVSVSVDNAPPTSPNQGSLWLDTNTGVLYVYLDDGDSEQWIQPVFPFPDVTNLATLSYVENSVTSYVNSAVENLASISYVNSAIANFPTELFNLNIAADDSTQRNIQSGNTIKFIGAGGVTTSSDADGAITITGGGSTGSITFAGTTIDSADSSSISFTPAVTFQSDVSVENELIVDNNITVGLNLSVSNILTTKDIVVTGEFSSQGSGTPELFSDNEILLTAGTRVEITSSPLKMCNFTSAERDLLIAENGDVIYNTTTNKLQVRANGVWVDLH
jgi:hypothetical protein